MDRRQIFDYVKEKFDVTEEYPFKDDFVDAVLRRQDTRKWFGIMMPIPKFRLKIESDEVSDVLNIKCDPLLLGTYLREKGFYPAYHSNKEHWISILLEECENEELLLSLIDESYRLVGKKNKKKTP